MKRKSSRYEVQPWPSVSSFELLFEPLYAVGPEESGKRISAYEVMLRREYRLALEGNLASQKVIMKVLRGNERARAVRDRRGSRIAYEEYRYPPCDYEAVLCLLGIAVRLNLPERYEIDDLGRYVPDFIRRPDDPTLRLNPWAFDLAAQRLKLVDEEKRDWLAKRVMPAGEESDSPVIIEPDPPKRDPKDTRFQKGKSGNPKGRPRKAEKLDPLPFQTFLDEKVPARINGEVRQITRLEALLFEMQKRAAEGYSGTARLLLELCLAEQEARWKRKEHVMPVVRYESESDVDTPSLRGLVELKVIHRRRQGFVMLERWIVEEAVKRLDRELTEAEHPRDDQSTQGRLARVVAASPAQEGSPATREDLVPCHDRLVTEPGDGDEFGCGDRSVGRDGPTDRKRGAGAPCVPKAVGDAPTHEVHADFF